MYSTDNQHVKLRTHFIGTHLLHNIYIFDGQVEALQLWPQTGKCILEVFVCPAFDVEETTFRLVAIIRVGASRVRS